MSLGVIPARGGSKGVPRKNIRLVRGKPLIAYAIECAKACPFLTQIIVSTEDEEIAEIAKKFGAEVPFFRPKELAQDTTAMQPVLEHALKSAETHYRKKFASITLLDPTAPLRTPGDVTKAWQLFQDGKWDAVLSCNSPHRSPYFNMMKLDHSQKATLVVPTDPPVIRRQDSPRVYDLNTVAWIYSKRAIVDLKARIPERTTLFEVPLERSIDLDTEEDFRYLEFKLGEL